MRFTFVAALVCVSFAVAFGLPSGSEFERVESSEPRTLTSLRNFFSPVVNWFRTELPEKTPSDIATDVKETAKGVQEWAQENPYIQSARRAFQPVAQWFQNAGNSLRNKTFRDMFQDTKETASRVDQAVGGWIDNNINEIN